MPMKYPLREEPPFIDSDLRQNDMKKAFTLAEVLITIGIVGVVSALTIPNLLTAYKAHRYRSQFLKSYSTIQQAFRQMEADGLSTDPTSYGVQTFYKTFSKYVKTAVDCGYFGHEKYHPQCYKSSSPKAYKTYDGKRKAHPGLLNDGELVLLDGTNLLFENMGGSYPIYVSVDLNGFVNPPNRWGYDLFTFHFKDGELRTMGSSETAYPAASYCNPTSTSVYNGIGCAHYAKNNTDYFKKIAKQLK